MSYTGKNPSRLATLNIPARSRSPPYVPHPQPRTTYPVQIPAVPRSLIGTKGWKDQISKDLHAPKVVVTRCAKTGRPMVYDEGYAMRELNEDAPEFVPRARFLTPKAKGSVVGSARPSSNSSRAPSPSLSVASVSSRTSESSTLASKSLWSASSRGTSRGTTPEPSKSRATSPLPVTPTTARPLIRDHEPWQPATPSTARPLHGQLPPTDPVELLYKHYREELRVAKDISHPIRALLETGVEPMQAKIIAALVIRLSSSSAKIIAALVVRLSSSSVGIRGGKDVFLAAVRAQALDLFRGHWENRTIWQNEPRGDHDYLTSCGVNIAGLLGSLFAVGLGAIISYSDIHRCVRLLVADKPAFLKLMAVHALLVHAGPAFCAGEAREHAKTVLAPVCEVDKQGRLVWGPHEESHVLVADLVQTFQSWLGH
ncbi:hypothetical protein C8F01DRAFT_1317981 [Mycena amicta]|nr:hypothetical protein C8F01DRAFT_1317981 [Mycena amicta]